MMGVEAKLAPPRRVWRWLVAPVILLLLGAAWIASWIAPEVFLPIGGPVRSDDFAFSVVGSRRMTLGEGAAARTYRVVCLRVQNQAKRVSYRFRRDTAVMLSDGGGAVVISAEGQ